MGEKEDVITNVMSLD